MAKQTISFLKKKLNIKSPSKEIATLGNIMCNYFQTGLSAGALKHVYDKRRKYRLHWYFDTDHQPVADAVRVFRMTKDFYDD